MDLAIPINTTELQPKLIDLSRQSRICLVALRIRLLKTGVKATGVNIKHLTEQEKRPETVMVTDKGVPQLDSFAKYAEAFFNMPHALVARFSAFWNRRISA
ncbi:hypothetical protein C7424_3947 [Pantoea ananatis]|nr:hypothetical protein C7424_3947 [Pantoea ananatis]